VRERERGIERGAFESEQERERERETERDRDLSKMRHEMEK
jgi:hypothetical protein